MAKLVDFALDILSGGGYILLQIWWIIGSLGSKYTQQNSAIMNTIVILYNYIWTVYVTSRFLWLAV